MAAGMSNEEWEKYRNLFFKEHLPTLIKRGFDVIDKSKLWSPWYVSRCLRPRMTPKKIAQEYDRNYGGSGDQFFPASLINLLREHCKASILQGEPIVSQD